MWVALAISAATFQTIRNALARGISGDVSPALNSWSRFSFNLPFCTLALAWFVSSSGWPTYSPEFFVFCLGTALTQLIGNVALVTAFRTSNFAESIVLHKLEVVFTALIGAFLFREVPSLTGWAGVCISAGGVLIMNFSRSGDGAAWRRALQLNRGAMLAIFCGLLLVFASFFLKFAVHDLVAGNPRFGGVTVEAALHTLFHTTWMEVVILTAFLAATDRREFQRVPGLLRPMVGIGFTGFCGSLCWFWAYPLTLVAYVKAVGQIEAVFAIGVALILWKEKQVLRQIPGMIVLLLGILLVLFD